jgi:acylphosphatase
MNAMPANDPSTKRRMGLRIRGRVQGVGYRYSALEQARRLGLQGWVRNTHDSDVELVAEGEEEQLRRLRKWCESGPPGARIAHVEEQWLAATGEFTDFHIRQ